MRGLTRIVLSLGAAAWPAWAAIYDCTDAGGRRITADRPIPECLDREQREFDARGIPRRTVGPAQSELERAAQEERVRQETLARQRAHEERARLRALLARYPTAEALAHDREAALAPVDEALRSARQRLASLEQAYRRLDAQALDPASQPAAPDLTRALEHNRAERATQRRYIADRQSEKARIQQRFEAMQRQLQPLWPAPAPAAVPASAPAP